MIIKVPNLYMLWAPSTGPLHRLVGLSREQARLRLLDRRANGEAFKGERVRPVRVWLQIQPDTTVLSYIYPPQPLAQRRNR